MPNALNGKDQRQRADSVDRDDLTELTEPLAAGRLQTVLTDYLDSTGVLHVLWPASRHPSPKVRALVDFLATRVFPNSA